jgi:hypothetical protein
VHQQFAAIPYATTAHAGLASYEGFYHAGMLIFLRCAGAYVFGEAMSSQGRADLVLELEGGRRQAIVEVKCGPGDPEALAREALQQIRARDYTAIARPGIPLTLAGLVFDPATRTVAAGGVVIEDGP